MPVSSVVVPCRPVACTIVANNYLAQARVFARSFLEHHPQAIVYVLLAGRRDPEFLKANEPFTLIPVEDLGIAGLPALCFRYSVLEFCTAVKPFFLEYLLTQKGHEHVLYFDPDIVFYAQADPLYEELSRHAIVLTPHLTDPLPDDGLLPDERVIQRSGTYNLGFIAVRKTPLVQDFLRWWQDRLRWFCFCRPEQGMFVDQRWIDLVPGLFPDVGIVTDPGCNVAYWNLHKRIPESCGGQFVVRGVPLRFFHFSGYDPLQPGELSRHQTRFRLRKLPTVALLARDYADRLKREGHARLREQHYTFGFFTDGTPVPPVARKLYVDSKLEEVFPDPFRTGDRSFLEFLQEHCCLLERVPRRGLSVGGHGKPALTRLHLAMHSADTALQRLFPRVPGPDALAYGYHLLHQPLPPVFIRSLEPLRGLRANTPRPIRRVHWLERRHTFAPYQWFCRTLRRTLGNRTFEQLASFIRRKGKRSVPVFLPLWPRYGARPFGVNVAGYLNANLGIGEAVRGNVRALQAAGIPLSLYPVFHRTAITWDPSLGKPQTMDYPYRFNLIEVNPDQFGRFADQVGEAFFAQRCSIAYWMWEALPFPEEWLPFFSLVQEVWTASTFTRDIFAAVSPVHVHVIPHAVTVSSVRRKTRRDFGLPENRFLFLFLFDFFSVFQRKNPLAVVEAFKRAFGPDEPVTLVIKSMNGDHNPHERAQLTMAMEQIRGIHIESVLSREETEDLLACCDAYVSLHRSEGFGLTLAEAMLLGKPVIATAFGGNTDFLDAGNGFPVQAHPWVLPHACSPYPAGSLWADPDVEQAAYWMRSVFDDPAQARQRALRGKETAERLFCPEEVGRLMRSRLEILAKYYC